MSDNQASAPDAENSIITEEINRERGSNMNLRRKIIKFLAASPLLANFSISAQTSASSLSSEQAAALSWGHININVSDLDASIEFYEKLGFEIFIPSIPYLGLTMGSTSKQVDGASRTALGLPENSFGRACIMQLGNTFPKIDLTQYDDLPQSKPLNNADLGLVRICLGSSNLATDYDRLRKVNVDFISAPQVTKGGMAEVATCIDPDGTLIELIQVHLDKWTV